MTTEADILYQNGNHWIAREGKCFRVYRDGATHATLTDSIGVSFPDALNRAKACADRREQVLAQQKSMRRS